MDKAKKRLSTMTKTSSILKLGPTRIIKNGYVVFQSNQASKADQQFRKDFYGNKIDKNKKHTIFMNLSLNQVIIVENWKEHNLPSKEECLKKLKCTIF